MSYGIVPPKFYQALQSGTPWHAGSQGWTRAPWPGWGQNTNRVGPRRLGVGQTGSVSLWPLVVGVGGIIAVFLLAGAAVGYEEEQRKKRHRANYRKNGKWSTKHKNDLPDSAFLYVAPGGRKEVIDGETYTIPRTQRKFPYKGRGGHVNLPHLRSAISRIPQANIPQAKVRPLQEKARKILALATGRSYQKLARRARRGRQRRAA